MCHHCIRAWRGEMETAAAERWLDRLADEIETAAAERHKVFVETLGWREF